MNTRLIHSVVTRCAALKRSRTAQVIFCCGLFVVSFAVFSFSISNKKLAQSQTTALQGSENKVDQLTHPPLQQTFTADRYRFVVAANDDWRTPTATGRLYENDSLLWQTRLPHDYGPRFAVVGSAGQVLLVDEFINVASPNALMLLDAQGDMVARYSFDDIRRLLNVSTAELVSQSVEGWWVASVPELSADQAYVQIGAGGKMLRVSLATGELLL